MRCLKSPATDCKRCCTAQAAPARFMHASRAWNAFSSHQSTSRCCASTPQHDSAASAADPFPSTVALPLDVGGAASLLGTAWDPEGIFSKSVHLNFSEDQQMGDLIARRERERTARRVALAAQEAREAPLPPLPPHARPLRPLPIGPSDPSPASGLRPEELSADILLEVESLLASNFMSVDLQCPGVRLLHLDPPVITVNHFLTDKQCEQMIQQAEASGRMQASRIGASNVSSLYGNAASNRRTSTSMMLTPGAAGPIMDNVVSELQARGKKLLRLDSGPAWGPSGKLPRSGQYCYEMLQVARYDAGQHFLAHEDGFPPALAATNGFQRHATLLVYLNDVPRGGETHFDYLKLAVRPEKGKALLFFPAFADGMPDVRSLHTAEDAIDIKYATQQWIARGWQRPSTDTAAQVAAYSAGSGAVKQAASATNRQESNLEQRERAGRAAKGSRVANKSGKGFGSKQNK